VTTTNAQVRKFMDELAKQKGLGLAAARAGMDRKTGRKYRDAGKFPSELPVVRDWRTREDPFDDDWETLELRLIDAPELEAKTLFEQLLTSTPDKYAPGQLRTLQRRVREWRARWGPDKEVYFAQEHRPGEATQTDFFWATVALGLTLLGEPYNPLLCHVVLPYSNWEWLTVCLSESIAAIKRGVQSGVFQLGRVTTWHQTDNSTAATHNVRNGGTKRPFNDEYQALMDHLGMKPRTIEVRKSNQNGDVEAANGACRRRLKQHLLVRGSGDFESVETFEAWIQSVATKANALRAGRLAEELAVMRPISVQRLPEYSQLDVLVTGWSTIRVRHNAYSVPSRLIGEWVRVRVYDRLLEVRHGELLQLAVERLQGRNGHRINYRHIIWSLVQKPGAFALYKYREELFPSLVFRRAYDALSGAAPSRQTDLEYLRVLHLAASTLESEVEAALERLLAAGGLVSADQVKREVVPGKTEIPLLPEPVVDLSGYDELLSSEVAS
jgi:hypothetical protein